ncbi:MAG: M1 family aminopeptidase [Arenicellales bacterium]
MWFKKHIFYLLLLMPGMVVAELPILQHNLTVKIDHQHRSYTATDRISLDASSAITALPDFYLNSAQRLISLNFDGKSVEPAFTQGDLRVPGGTRSLEITYGGEIDPSRWPFIVWLPSDGWYPIAEGYRVLFNLSLEVSPEWNALSQGRPGASQNGTHSWTQTDPQEGIYLVAGPWKHYTRESGTHRAGVMLIEPDADLADRYLNATLEYLNYYSELIGSFPYHSFTLVENTRQTGWGMPGFTLLGSMVIRLPFILHTSYPHEVLHNWWGNGVFTDDRSGNWSEGLTTYLSDYWLKEAQGEGRQYRLNALIAWHDFAAEGGDFPLGRFVGRHDRATQAVGYGKGMFLFHMLRGELGEAKFIAGLRGLYSRFRFSHANFEDIRSEFEHQCECQLEGFFNQWLQREGAPELRLDSVKAGREGEPYQLIIQLSQMNETPWELLIPVRVTDQAGNESTQTIKLDTHSDSFTFELGTKPALVEIDPEFELFRKLVPGEKPITLSNIFAAKQVAVVATNESYLPLAKGLTAQYPGWQLYGQNEQSQISEDVVILLGWSNSAASLFRANPSNNYRITEHSIQISDQDYPIQDDRVLTLTDKLEVNGKTKTVLWIATQGNKDLSNLMRRLVHYGRFSYAVFETPDSRAVQTSQWQTQGSSLRWEIGAKGVGSE